MEEQRFQRFVVKSREAYKYSWCFSTAIVCEENGIYKQNSQYDKVFRENMRFTLPGVLEKVLKLNIVASAELKDKIQITKQKEVDALRVVTDASGETYVLHIEFESGNPDKMNFRMAEYRAMLHQIYDHPVKQYVLYLGKSKSRISNKISLPKFRFEYDLISFSDLPYELFLTSASPEEQILTVLADFGDADPDKVIQEVLEKICRDDHGKLIKNKYFEQLRVIIQLRNLETHLNKAMLTVNSFFKKERDVLFKWGLEQGIEQGAEKRSKEMARKLKDKNLLLVDEIAELTGLSAEEIEAL
jgi:predicted transposase/invertase (TIGR01784 family)